MKLRHKAKPTRQPEPVIDERYQAEIDSARRHAEKAWRRAEREAECAELRAAARPGPETFAAREVAREELLLRLDELREIEQLMQQAPGGSGSKWSGRGSVRNPLPKGSKL